VIFGKTHFHRVEVPFDLLDAGMVVYHANYLVLCDRARWAALSHAGYPAHKLWSENMALVIRENHSEYFRPAVMAQKLIILTSSIEASNASFKVLQRIVPAEMYRELEFPDGFHSGEITVDRKQVIHQLLIKLACVTLKPTRSARIPDQLKSVLQFQPTRYIS
jgi:acyl-CoA thioester hydrolase